VPRGLLAGARTPSLYTRRVSPGRASVLSLCLLLAACGGHRASYPLGATVEFDIQCVNQLWPGASSAPLDVREAFCGCVVRRCQERYDVDEFARIRLALDRAGYRLDAAGIPPEFGALVADCQAALDRGRVPVK
jgi:hypothetical protein